MINNLLRSVLLSLTGRPDQSRYNKDYTQENGGGGTQPNSSAKIQLKTKETARNIANIINKQTVQNLNNNDSNEKLLGSLYKLMVKIQYDNKLQQELYSDHQKERENIAERQHKEIIDALSMSSLNKKTKNVSQSETPKKVKVEQTQKPSVKNKTTEKPKTDIDKSQQESIKKAEQEAAKKAEQKAKDDAANKAKEKAKEEADNKAKEEADNKAKQEAAKKAEQKAKDEIEKAKKSDKNKAEKIKKQDKNNAPPVEKNDPTTTGTPPKISGTSILPASAGLLGAVSTQMARAEAPSGPEAYTQANIVGEKGPEHQIIKGNLDVTTGKKFDKDLTEMTMAEVISLQKRRYEHYVKVDKTGKKIHLGGSAMGRYQFIPGTLAEQAQATFHDGWQNLPFSKDNQDALNRGFIKNNARILTSAGLPVNTATLYMMHFFGNTTQTKKVISSNDDVKMTEILSPMQAQQNRSIAAMTVKDYKEHLAKKGYNFEGIDNKRLQSEPVINNQGTSVNTSSTEHQKLNEQMDTSVASTTYNQSNYNMYQSQQNRPTIENYNDKSAYEKKSRA